MKLIGSLVLVGLVLPIPAFAYVDPGTGSVLLQLLLGGTAGLVVFWKLFWNRLSGRFRRPRGPSGPTK